MVLITISALRNGKVESSVEIICALQECQLLESKAANLRAVLNTDIGKEVLLQEGDLILHWVNKECTGWQFSETSLSCTTLLTLVLIPFL